MLFDLHVDPSLDIPIYAQLTDIIRAQIRTGQIAQGEKLPTVRKLSEKCGIALGTVMRAYSELENTGYIEKASGKGTFVCWKNDEKLPGRKEAALAAIDRMLDEMEKLHFSPAETGIFLDLKLRERHEETQPVRIAVVEADEALMYQIAESLSHFQDVSVSSFRLQDILAFPYRLGEEFDIIVGQKDCCDELKNKLPDAERLLPVALRFDARTSAEICRVQSKHQVKILCRNERLGRLLRQMCEEYYGFETSDILLLDHLKENAFRKTDAVLMLEYDVMSCSDEKKRMLDPRAASPSFIRCTCVPDQGSMIVLAQKISDHRKNTAYTPSFSLPQTIDVFNR